MFYKATFYDRSANMNLSCRYGVRSDYTDGTYNTTEIYFGNADEKLFVAGQATRNQEVEREERLKVCEYKEQLKALARQFAEEHYPDWQSVHAYWDNEKTLSDEDKPKGLRKK